MRNERKIKICRYTAYAAKDARVRLCIIKWKHMPIGSSSQILESINVKSITSQIYNEKVCSFWVWLCFGMERIVGDVKACLLLGF